MNSYTKDRDYEPCEIQPVFYINQFMFVPHYVKKHHWVAVGGQTLTTNELLDRGAKVSLSALWERGWVKTMMGRNNPAMMSQESLKHLISRKANAI
jgi:hypothetical protein